MRPEPADVPPTSTPAIAPERSGADGARPRIVVGVDGSSGSKDALRWAARLAETFDATIDAVAAWDFPVSLGWDIGPLGYDPQPDIERTLANTVDEAFPDGRPAGMRLAALEGSAARVVLAAAQDALMIVVGSRGHGGLPGLLLGSVSSRVAEHASCPVLVVHGTLDAPVVA